MASEAALEHAAAAKPASDRPADEDPLGVGLAYSEGPDFYETAYSTVDTDVQTRVRSETYDEDLGQAGWLQASEAREFASWLGADVTSLLDVACGSGGISAFLAASSAPRSSGSTTIRTRSRRRTNGAPTAAPSRSSMRTSRSPSRTGPSTSSSRTTRCTTSETAPRSCATGRGPPDRWSSPLHGRARPGRPRLERGDPPQDVHGLLRADPMGANERAIDSAGLELLGRRTGPTPSRRWAVGCEPPGIATETS